MKVIAILCLLFILLLISLFLWFCWREYKIDKAVKKLIDEVNKDLRKSQKG